MSVASVATVRTRSASPGDGARLAEIDRATWASAVRPAPPVAAGTDFLRPGRVDDLLMARMQAP